MDKTIPVHGDLVRWVRELYAVGKMTDAGDFRLMTKDPSFRLEELERVLTVGLCCCLFEPLHRPLMRDVVAALQGSSSIFSGPLPLDSFNESSPALEYPSMYDDDDTTQPFEDYTKDQYFTAQQSIFKKVDRD